MEEVVARFGRIDILDHNAFGVDLVAQDPDILGLTGEHLTRTLAANLVGPFLCCKYVIPHMVSGGGGSIVNIASVAALTADVALSAYAMSKAGVVELTRLVAIQYGKQRVRCNAIAPAVILTPNTAAAMPADYRESYTRHSATPYLGAPDDIAGLVAFLASDRARYMTGHVIPVDGGITAALPIVADRRDQLGMS